MQGKEKLKIAKLKIDLAEFKRFNEYSEKLIPIPTNKGSMILSMYIIAKYKEPKPSKSKPSKSSKKTSKDDDSFDSDDETSEVKKKKKFHFNF